METESSFRVHKSMPVDPITSEMNAVLNNPLHILKIDLCFNIILLFTLRLRKSVFYICFPAILKSRIYSSAAKTNDKNFWR
jgi:hypothetical protein